MITIRREEKGIKSIRIRKKEAKLSVFIYGITIYVKNPKVLLDRLIDLNSVIKKNNNNQKNKEYLFF